MDLNQTFSAAEAHLAAGRNQEAIRLFEEAHNVLDDAHPLPLFDKAKIAVRLTLARARSGETESLVEDLEYYYQYFSDFAGEDSEDALDTLSVLAEVRQILGDRDGAIRDAKKIWETARDADLYPEDRQGMAEIAAVRLEALGEHTEASRVRSEAEAPARQRRQRK